MTVASATVDTGKVDTGKVTRRTVRLETVEAAIGEARRLAELEISGKVEYLGNRTVGQILNHVGAWAEFVYVPNELHMPWIVRLLARPMKGRFLNKGLPAGRVIPKVPGGTLVMERVSTAEGLARFEKAFLRLKNEAPTQRSPVFGMLTQEEAIKLNLRHAELHMGFIKN